MTFVLFLFMFLITFWGINVPAVGVLLSVKFVVSEL